MKKELKNVKKHLEMLQKVGNTFKDAYELTFSNGERVLFEYDECEEMKYLTFNQADVQIRKVATSLINVLNGIKDEYIALNLDTSKEWVIVFWAILMSGNKPYLVNLRHPRNLVEKFLKELNIKYSIELNDNPYGLKSIKYSDLISKTYESYPDFEFADEIALSTSGTTLVDKICFYTGKEIISQIKNSQYIIDLCPKVQIFYHGTAKFLAFLPFYHIFGLEAVYFWFSMFGYPLVFVSDYSPETILKTIRKHEVTHVINVPIFWEEIAKGIKKEIKNRDEKTQKKFYKGIDLSNKLWKKYGGLGTFFAKRAFKEVREKTLGNSVLFSITGGSFIKEDTLKIINGIGYNLHVGYGATEIGITSFEYSDNAAIRNSSSIGFPIESITYEIRDGELFVKGESICKKMRISGEEVAVDEWFATGDLAKKDENGRYYIIGRKFDIVIGDNGENINPDTLEKSFNFDEKVKNFSLLGLNEVLSLVVEVEKNASKEEVESIFEYAKSINETFPLGMRIKQFFGTSDRIQNENAIKVSRKYIVKNVQDGNIRLVDMNKYHEKAFILEANEIEKKIIKLFAEVTQKEEADINVETNFVYDLGGNSFDYYGLVAAIYEEFEVKLNVDVNNPPLTVRDVAKMVEEAMSK